MKQGILDSGCQAMKMKESNPWRTGNQESESWNCPSLLPHKHFWTTAKGRKIQVESNQLPELEIYNPRDQDGHGVQRSESCTQREAQRSSEDLPQVFSSVIRACMWVKDQRSGEGSSESIKVNRARSHTELESMHVPTSQNGKTCNSWGRLEDLEKSFLRRFGK